MTISFQALNKLCIVVCFEVNRQYIAANLCENRSKPEKKCNGKCQLLKKLDKEQKREETPTVKKTESFWAVCPAIMSFMHSFSSTTEFQDDRRIFFISPLYRSFFHPPNV